MLGAFFAGSTVLGFVALGCVCLRDVPKITGTCALIMTLAALGVAILR